MKTPDAEGGENWLKPPENLNKFTEQLVLDIAGQILDKSGIEMDSQLSLFDPEVQAKLLDLLSKIGLTEETPIIRKCLLPVKDQRLIPVYYRQPGEIAYLGIDKSLHRHLPLPALRIFCDNSRTPQKRKIGEGIEFYFYYDGLPFTKTFTRDPSTGRLVVENTTEAQGRDILTVFGGILNETLK